MLIKTRSCAALVIAAMVLLAACGEPISTSELITKGQQALARGDRAEALIHLKNAVLTDPKSGEAHLQLAHAYVAAKDYLTAEREYSRARAMKISEDRIAPNLSLALLETGEFQKLLDEVKPQAVTASERRASVYAARTLAQLGLRNRDAAKEELAKAEALQAGQADVVLAKTRVVASDGNLNHAQEIVEHLLEREINNVKAWLLKAELLNALEKTDEAVNAFQHTLVLAPDNYRAHAVLAELFLRINDIQSAKPHISQAARIAPDAVNTHWVKAMLAMAEKDYVGAAQEAHAVLTRAPDHLPALRLSALANMQLGNATKVPEALSALLAKKPNDPVALKLMIEVQFRLNHARSAQRYLDKLDVEHSDDPELLLLASQVALALGESERAQRYVLRVEEIQPDDTRTKIDLALFNLNSGKAEQGIAALEQLASSNTGSNAGELVVLAQLRNKRFDDALLAIDRLEEKRPDDAWVEHLRGLALLGNGERTKARDSFEHAYKLNDNIPPSLLALARMDIEDGKSDQARKRIETFLAHNPRDTFALLALADMDATAGNDQAYLDGLEKVVSVDPRNLAASVLTARYWLSRNDPRKALFSARSAAEIAPDNVAVRILLAQAQVVAGDVENALVAYRELIETEPDAADPHVGMAQALMKIGNETKARSELALALKLDPAHIRAQELIARIDLRNGDVDKAMAVATNMRRTHAESEIGLVLEGDIRMSKAQYKLAIESYEKAFSTSPSSSLLMRLVRALDAVGDASHAQRRMSAWLEGHPHDNDIRGIFADHALNAGEFSLAVRQYEALLRATPNDWRLLNNLAWATHKNGDEKALDIAQKAFEMAPNQAVVLDTYGWILVQQGQTTTGLGLLKRAQSKAPEDGDVSYHFAYALDQAGDRVRARSELERLLAKQQDFPEAAQAKALLARIK